MYMQEGDGVRDNAHQCPIMSHENQLHYWSRSLRRWETKIQRSGLENYSVKKNMDWVDIHNSGISHFGIHPDKLPRHCIRFDVFHLRCSITRRLMSYLRKFLMSMTTDLMEMFSNLLRTFWSEYNVLVWNMNQPFSCFIGMELLAFINNSDILVSFLKSNFCETDTLKDLCDELMVWKDISPFLVITEITNVDIYQQKLQQFNENLATFYRKLRESGHILFVAIFFYHLP